MFEGKEVLKHLQLAVTPENMGDHPHPTHAKAGTVPFATNSFELFCSPPALTSVLGRKENHFALRPRASASGYSSLWQVSLTR